MHGSIVCVDGEQALCYTKRVACECASYMYGRGWISDHEILVVQNAIIQSSLPWDSHNCSNIATECFGILAKFVAQPGAQPAPVVGPAPKAPATHRTTSYGGQRVPLN